MFGLVIKETKHFHIRTALSDLIPLIACANPTRAHVPTFLQATHSCPTLTFKPSRLLLGTGIIICRATGSSPKQAWTLGRDCNLLDTMPGLSRNVPITLHPHARDSRLSRALRKRDPTPPVEPPAEPPAEPPKPSREEPEVDAEPLSSSSDELLSDARDTVPLDGETEPPVKKRKGASSTNGLALRRLARGDSDGDRRLFAGMLPRRKSLKTFSSKKKVPNLHAENSPVEADDEEDELASDALAPKFRTRDTSEAMAIREQ